MPSSSRSQRNRLEIEELAEGWGKLLANEAMLQATVTEMSLTDMEEIAARATKALVKGAVETMAEKQAEAFNEQQPCPTCGKRCPVRRKPRRIEVRGGSAQLHEPVGHCSTCRRDFFPST